MNKQVRMVTEAMESAQAEIEAHPFKPEDFGFQRTRLMFWERRFDERIEHPRAPVYLTITYRGRGKWIFSYLISLLDLQASSRAEVYRGPVPSPDYGAWLMGRLEFFDRQFGQAPAAADDPVWSALAEIGTAAAAAQESDEDKRLSSVILTGLYFGRFDPNEPPENEWEAERRVEVAAQPFHPAEYGFELDYSCDNWYMRARGPRGSVSHQIHYRIQGEWEFWGRVRRASGKPGDIKPVYQGPVPTREFGEWLLAFLPGFSGYYFGLPNHKKPDA